MFLPLPLLSALLHLYTGWRLLTVWWSHPLVFAGLAALLAVSSVLLPWSLRPPGFLAGSRWAGALKVAGLVCMGFFSSLLVLTLLRDVLLLLAAAGTLLVPAADGKAALLSLRFAQGIPLLALAVTALGFVNARRTAAVRRIDVPIAGLPPGLDGFTIAQMSDIHVGPTIRKAYVAALVQRVNTLGADLVAITGDLVDGTVPALREHVAPLAGLQSRHGTFFVTGNHEYYAGAHAWIAELRRIGMRVLLNSHVVLPAATRGGAPLVLAGVADYGAGHFDPAHRSDPQRALEGAPSGAGARVLLAHQPRSAAAAAEAGFDLQLSGHTHGGQFWPWNHFVRFQQPFTAGLHRLGRLWVYVSRGTGYWGPPKRFGAPSEITLLRLVPA
ncbi:MAG: metallophosphoesterase [Pseudomonadota bacterium]